MVDIVIPVYNEAANIKKCLGSILKEVHVPFRVLIVYDRDEDTTLPPAQSFQTETQMSLLFVKNKYGRGALNAIKTGLQTSSSEYVIVTMADLSDPPGVINQMYQKAITESCDLVCGSRYMRGGSQNGGPLFKSLLSRLAGISLHYLAGVPTHDATNSFKLYSKRVLNSFELESTGGFEIGLELVVKSHFSGFKVAEVPTSWVDRADGESNFKLWSWIPKYMKWYTKAFIWRWFVHKKTLSV